jgi:hypothetical protein
MLRPARAYLATPLFALVTLGCAEAPEGSSKPSSQGACSAEAESIRGAVFAASCDGAGCHGSQSPAAGLDLVGGRLDQLMGVSSALCRGWSLVVACRDGGALCGSSCVDTASDHANCGGCAQACGAGEACVAGSCQCAASGAVSFKADVAPILDQACTSAGCHTGARPKEALGLAPNEAYAELVNVAASQCGGERKLVVPGSPSTSYLMQKLLDIDVCTGSQMPKAGRSLPKAGLDAICGWICSGAPNN